MRSTSKSNMDRATCPHRWESPPVVLAFRSDYNEFNRRFYAGIFAKSRAFGWNIQTIEYGRACCSTKLRPVVEREVPSLEQLFDFWKPDGCIVECNVGNSNFLPKDFKDVPTVFFDWHPSVLPPGSACVYSGSREVAVCAARELLSFGFEDYGFVPWYCPESEEYRLITGDHSNEPIWSFERHQEFARIVGMAGFRLHVFDGTSLEAWLRNLPKPCGVFAANDVVARDVVSACHLVGVSIPDDLVLVGVDDWDEICENTSPTISSVRTDNESSGRIVVELLAELMSKRQVVSRQRTFGVVGLTRRGSSCRFRGADHRVIKAVEYIRCHACEGISPPDVFSVMGCSRSLANLLFRQDIGHTILDEIHAVRLEKVKELLTHTDMDFAAMPDFCGYASLADLRRVFRQRIGYTLGSYRKQKCMIR